jgi:hypothetical protein
LLTASTFEDSFVSVSTPPHLPGLRLEQVALDGEAVTLHLAASARFAPLSDLYAAVQARPERLSPHRR